MKHIAFACVAALSLGACSGSDPSASESTAVVDETTTTTTAPVEDLIGDDEFRARCVNVEGDAALKVIEPACAYLVSLITHDGSKIPIAPDAWRLEQGVNTGTSGQVIQEDMSKQYFDYIKGLRDIRWFVSGDDEAIAYYVLDIQDAPGIKATMVAERFKVEDGLITEIEAVFAFCRVPVANTAAPDGTDMCPEEFSPPKPVA